MGNAHIHAEGFEWIELHVKVTPDEFKDKFGLDLQVARNWLSKWASRGYLKHEYSVESKTSKKPSGYYRIGKKAWSEIYFDNGKYD